MSGGTATGAPDRLEIPMAKGTLVRFFLTSLLAVAGCIAMLLLTQNRPSLTHSIFRVVAFVGIVFFGVTALYAGKRLFDPTPGLILDPEGLVDHSNAVGAGRVRWAEIREIRVTQSVRQRFLTVIVDDPERFLRRGNAMTRKVAAANHRLAGSPINITARTLAIPFDELVTRTSEFYRHYGKRA
ncbi:MAG TPA: STM3941 family protein [Candidatus Binatia bacterium]|nr:STM3941 family protein [Candidatus Binatia bacterium]